METLRLKHRPAIEEDMESWDEDDFVLDNVTFRSASSATSAIFNRRDSLSSRMSLRSDLESQHGEDDRQLLLPGDDEKSKQDAIAAAAKAGIPLPNNVPASALTVGTIKRLGGRRIQRIMQDDWEHDLEIPDSPHGLHIKLQDHNKFPALLCHLNDSPPTRLTSSDRLPSAFSPNEPSAYSPHEPTTYAHQPNIIKSDSSHENPRVWSMPVGLAQFMDCGDDDRFLGDGMATIKVSKLRQTVKPLPLITPPTPQKPVNSAARHDADFDADFDIPSSGGQLTLATRRDIPKTPSNHPADDTDWGEGSLGTRFGGTRRDGRSNRSSSVSAFSPSVASSVTVESEDDVFDGLVLPTGPVDFTERLHRRDGQSSDHNRSDIPSKAAHTPSAGRPVHQSPQIAAETVKPGPGDDFELGDGEIFVANKLTNHRNIKVKDTRPSSPTRPKTAVSLTFTNKPCPPSSKSRLPRLSHDRTQPALEPVSESGGPILRRARGSVSRLGHSAQSSISSLQTTTSATTSTSPIPSLLPPTPRKRDLGSKTSSTNLRAEPTTTSAQLLRLKRSLPALRSTAVSTATAAPSRFQRPQSRTEGRQQAFSRPKTPVERSRPISDSTSALARKHPVPFLPAGASHSQSQHITAKSSRVFRRHDSDNLIELRPGSRAASRSTMRSPSPRKRDGDGIWTRLSRPRKPKQFGDGHELDMFDDLPTSIQAESRYIKQPASASSKVQIRSRVYQHVLPNRTGTPAPLTPVYSTRPDHHTPHFARETTASRLAREAALSHRSPSAGPMLPAAPVTPHVPFVAQRVPQILHRSHLNSGAAQNTVRAKRRPAREPTTPHLITNLNTTKSPKVVNGMNYNPETFRWEGNENALSAFDPPVSSPPSLSLPGLLKKDRENLAPRPALIANRSTVKGVQVVGGMVFDPKKMCWLKLGPKSGSKPASTEDRTDRVKAVDNIDDDDVFRDIPDLVDYDNELAEGASSRRPGGDPRDKWLIDEVFDVGKLFETRQFDEEMRCNNLLKNWHRVRAREVKKMVDIDRAKGSKKSIDDLLKEELYARRCIIRGHKLLANPPF